MASAKGWFKRQKIMEKVVIALIPAMIGAIYFFGWRSLLIVLWCIVFGIGAEYLMASRRGDPATGSVLVTAMLYGLSLPATVPLWMAAVGIVFAIVFGKEVFGGFGRNIFNPAIVGRTFVYIAFPLELTGRFPPVWRGGFAGFAHWAPRQVVGDVQALTAATPMWFRRDIGFADSAMPYTEQLRQLFLGDIGGVYQGGDGLAHALGAGSMGEVSAVLLIIGGIYLLATKTANWRLVLGSLIGAVAANVLFRNVLGADKVPPLLWSLSSGALLYACFFMVTDPVSAPKDKTTQYIYAFFIGFMIIFLRWKSIFAGAVSFAILLGNTIGPSIEMLIKWRKQAKKDKDGKRKKGGSTRNAEKAKA